MSERSGPSRDVSFAESSGLNTLLDRHLVGRGRVDHAALASGLVAMLLSLAGAWRPSIWYDEAATLSAVHRPWWSLWKLVHHVDIVHLLYYSLLRCWVAVFGSSTFSIRAMSAVLLGACCILAVQVCRDLLGTGAAHWAAVMLPVLPGLSWCGLDARPTALSCLTTMLSTWVLLRADRTDRRTWWIIYGLTVVLTVAAQLLTVLLVPIHLLLVRHRRMWCASVIGPLALAAGFAVLARAQSGQLSWLTVTLTEAIPSLLFSGNVLGLRSDSGVLVTFVAPAVLAVVTWALALRGARWRRPYLILLGWAVLPASVAAGWSLFFSPIYQERYFTWCVPAFAMLVGSGLHRIQTSSSTKRAVVLVVVAILAAAPIVVAQRHTDAKYLQDYRTLATRVAQLPRTGTGILYATPGSRAAAATYPEEFRGLRDLSLARGPVQTGTFWGTNRSTASALQHARALHLSHLLFLYEWTEPLRQRPELPQILDVGCRLQWVMTVRRTNAAWFSCTTPAGSRPRDVSSGGS